MRVSSVERPPRPVRAGRRTPPSPAVAAAAAVLLTPTLPKARWVWAPPAGQRVVSGISPASPRGAPESHAAQAIQVFNCESSSLPPPPHRGEEDLLGPNGSSNGPIAAALELNEAQAVSRQVSGRRGRFASGTSSDDRHTVSPSVQSSSAEPQRREVYGRPVNGRDLGHLCYHCRRPFNALGIKLVVERHGCREGHRFHPDCWQQRSQGGAVPEMFGRMPVDSHQQSEAVSGSHGGDVETDLVTAYADQWRRAGLEAGRPPFPRHWPPRARMPRREASVLDGLISTEDERGGRRVARGLSRREIEVAMSQWACSGNLEEQDCAICLLRESQPVLLPCGHTFCASCVEPWLGRCGLCPMCRQSLRHHIEGALLPTQVAAGAGGLLAPFVQGNAAARQADDLQLAVCGPHVQRLRPQPTKEDPN